MKTSGWTSSVQSQEADRVQGEQQVVCLYRATPRLDARDPDRDLDHHLRAAARRSRQYRRHPVRRRRLRRSRRQGQSGKGTRPQSADLAAISDLDRRAAARRSRLFLCVGKAGAAGDPAAHSDHGAAGGPGAAVLRRDRHSARRHQRRASGFKARLRLADRQPERPVAAFVLARPADPDGFGFAVRQHADLQSESEDLDRGVRDLCRSGAGGRFSQRRADHAHHALLDAGNPAAGLHPHRARQGRLGSLGQLPPRAARMPFSRSLP